MILLKVKVYGQMKEQGIATKKYGSNYAVRLKACI